MKERNKKLEVAIEEALKKKEEISLKFDKSKQKPIEKSALPKDKEMEELEKTFKALQIKNQNVNNKITSLKMNFNMDNLSKYQRK